MTSPPASGRHLLKFEKRRKMSHPTALFALSIMQCCILGCIHDQPVWPIVGPTIGRKFVLHDAIVGQIVCQTGWPDDRLVYTYFQLAHQPVGWRIASIKHVWFMRFISRPFVRRCTCKHSSDPTSNRLINYANELSRIDQSAYSGAVGLLSKNRFCPRI